MEILQFLTSFLSNEENLNKVTNLIGAFQNGTFNIKNLLNSIDIKTILPFISEFLSFSAQKNPTKFVGQGEGLAPLANIADKEIIYTLNKYLSIP